MEDLPFNTEDEAKFWDYIILFVKCGILRMQADEVEDEIKEWDCESKEERLAYHKKLMEDFNLLITKFNLCNAKDRKELFLQEREKLEIVMRMVEQHIIYDRYPILKR